MQGPNLQLSWVPWSSPACLLGAISICRKLAIEDTVVSHLEALLDSKGQGMRAALILVGGLRPPSIPVRANAEFS